MAISEGLNVAYDTACNSNVSLASCSFRWNTRHTTYTAEMNKLNDPQSIQTRDFCAIKTPESTMTFGIVMVQAPLLPNGTV